jgi:hypothetical protein
VNLAGRKPLGGPPATPPDQREPTTSTLAAVGREPPRPASCARASAQQASRADDYNVRQANLDTPSARTAASRCDLHDMPELQHGYRAGLATTTCGRPISAHISTWPVASQLNHRAVPELSHDADTELVETTCSTPTSMRIAARPTVSHFDQHAAPEPGHINSAGPVTTTCGRPTSTHISARPVASPLDQPAGLELQHSGRDGPATTTCGT